MDPGQAGEGPAHLFRTDEEEHKRAVSVVSVNIGAVPAGAGAEGGGQLVCEEGRVLAALAGTDFDADALQARHRKNLLRENIGKQA